MTNEHTEAHQSVQADDLLGQLLEDAAYECLTALSGVDTYDTNLRNHPQAWAAIEAFAAKVLAAEREHQEFVERWHGERRKREALADAVERCHWMLITEPDTKGALFKAENILREALVDAKTKSHNVVIEGPEQAQLANGPARMKGSTP